jgi:AraC-like DNA-binding protein
MPLPYSYRETAHPANERCAPEAAWRFFAARECRHRVLPDGRCDIILRFRSDGSRVLGTITPIVTGPATRFNIVQVPAGTGYVGVRLRPGTARAVLGTDPRMIANRGLVGNAALTEMPSIGGLCARADRIESLVEELASFVAGRLVRSAIDDLSVGMIDTLHVSGGRIPIADLARLHEVDARTVQRRIVSATGLAPKQLAMIVQFHRALRLRFHHGLDVASAAIEAGYADQAHMSRVFRLMGGISPARLPDLVLAGFPI